MLKTLVTLVRSNRYFFIPFFLWTILGGALLSLYTKDELFLSVNSRHSAIADILVTGFTYLGDGIAFGLLLAVLLVMRRWRLFLSAGITLLLITLVVQGIKHMVDAPRPIAYFPDPTMLHAVPWITVHSGLSFPSGHTSTAFGMFAFLAFLWSNKKAGLLLFALGLATAHSRLYLSQHFFVDVYAGSIIGTLCCAIVYSAFEASKRQTPGATCPHTAVLQNAAASPELLPG
ncbi:phosphatase PAP2 family protein [Chitinophaga lutea]